MQLLVLDAKIMSHTDMGKNYRIVHDPDELWGEDPCFRYYEVVAMLQNGFLSEGTKFEAFGRTYVVVSIRKRLCLKKIGK